MECNIGEKERKIRMAVGITAGVCALMCGKARWRVPLTLIAMGGIASATTGVCLLNTALGIDNSDADKEHAVGKGTGRIAGDHHEAHKKRPARM